MDIVKSIKNFIKPQPNPNRKKIKVDLVFVIFYAVIVWRVALNLFTNAGFLPVYWQDYHYWLNNIIGNIFALFGLVWIFRIYLRSLKGINPIALEILREIGDKVPGAKNSPAFKNLQRKYNVD